ncbi:MAG: cytidine deaminase, partial [Lachnospiraceae bacterium]|nr:cytidine deaminase [Lachnospiraceae bacterium]
WGREGGNLDTKYFFVCHAELNAILNYRGSDMAGSKVYTTLFPCNECCKALIQKGISEVIYYSDKYSMTDSVIASKRMFDSAGVSYRRYEPIGRKVEIEV